MPKARPAADSRRFRPFCPAPSYTPLVVRSTHPRGFGNEPSHCFRYYFINGRNFPDDCCKYGSVARTAANGKGAAAGAPRRWRMCRKTWIPAFRKGHAPVQHLGAPTASRPPAAKKPRTKSGALSFADRSQPQPLEPETDAARGREVVAGNTAVGDAASLHRVHRSDVGIPFGQEPPVENR